MSPGRGGGPGVQWPGGCPESGQEIQIYWVDTGLLCCVDTVKIPFCLVSERIAHYTDHRHHYH